MKTHFLLFALVLSSCFLYAQSIEVKQSDKIKIDNGTVGKANAGDVIQYKVNIQNTGGANATGVQLNAVPDTKTTFVNGSFVSTSVAVNDAYTCTGNVGINVPVANGVLINDFDDNLGGATLTCNTCNPTTNGGTVTLNNDGSFMYVPAAGYTGSDQFTYTINDATIPDGATPIAGDITATVTITISNMIWFIDNSSVAALSDGRRSSPFKTLASFESVNGTGGLNPAAGHTIYIEHTGTNYSGGVSLENNQIVIGEGHTGTSTMVANENLSVALSFALAPFSLALPNIDGSRPVIVNAGGDGVTLAANNNLRGFDVGNCSDFGIDDNGNVGTLTINEVSITNGTGGGIRADAGGTLAVTLGTLNSTGGANGVNLNNVGGNFTVSNTTSITNSTSAAVTIANNTSTVNFNVLNITNTTSNQTGILASGGTINSSSGTINTGSGRAVDIDNTTLGMMLTAVSCNGCTTGIDLNTTTGSFAVNGTGMAGTGGTIQNGTIGINLTSTRNVSLAGMQLNDFTDFAIRGNSVVNFTLNNTVVNGVNGNNAAADEGSIRFNELTGFATISNCNLSGGFEDNFRLGNSSGTLNRITFSNTTIGTNSTTDGNDGITIESTNSAIINVSVLNSFFTSSRADLFQLNLLNTSTMDLIFTGNSLSNNHPGIATGGGGVTISGGDNTGTGVNLTFNIANNTFRDADGHGILIVKSTDPGTFSGTFNNNQIGVQATADSGSKAGSGIKIQNAGLGTMTIAVTGNTIRQYNNFGIELLTGGGAMALSGNLNATVTGNTVANPGTGGLPMNGIHLNGGTVPGDTYQICTQIGGAGALANNITGSGANGGTDFRLRQRQATTVRLPGYAGANNNDAAVVTFVAGMNGGASGLASNNVPTGGGFAGGAACNMP